MVQMYMVYQVSGFSWYTERYGQAGHTGRLSLLDRLSYNFSNVDIKQITYCEGHCNQWWAADRTYERVKARNDKYTNRAW